MSLYVYVCVCLFPCVYVHVGLVCTCGDRVSILATFVFFHFNTCLSLSFKTMLDEAGGKPQQVRVLAALPEDASSVPSTHVRGCTAAHDSSSKGSQLSFVLRGLPHTYGTHVHV